MAQRVWREHTKHSIFENILEMLCFVDVVVVVFVVKCAVVADYFSGDRCLCSRFAMFITDSMSLLYRALFKCMPIILNELRTCRTDNVTVVVLENVQRGNEDWVYLRAMHESCSPNTFLLRLFWTAVKQSDPQSEPEYGINLNFRIVLR